MKDIPLSPKNLSCCFSCLVLNFVGDEKKGCRERQERKALVFQDSKTESSISGLSGCLYLRDKLDNWI